MAFILNPYVLMALQWAMLKGAPIVMSRFAKVEQPEETVFEGLASLQRGSEDIAGLLAVTGTQLVFTPAAAHARQLGLRLQLAEIEDVTVPPRRLLGVIPVAPNAIKVRSHRGIFRFVVDKQDSERWLLELRAALAGTDPIEVLPAV